MADYTGEVVIGRPVLQLQLQCEALVLIRKDTWRHCRKTPEFSVTLETNRGYSVKMCFTHLNANAVALPVEPYE